MEKETKSVEPEEVMNDDNQEMDVNESESESKSNKENISKLNTSISNLSMSNENENSKSNDKLSIEDITVSMMEDKIFELLLKDPTKKKKQVRNELEKYFDLEKKTLKKNEKFETAVTNVWMFEYPCTKLKKNN